MSRTMKDSGIPWIGEIPEGWRNAKYRYSGIFVKGKLPCEQNVEQYGKPIIGASEMLGKEYRNFSLDANVPTCQKQDILILWDGANAGIVANNCEGIVSSTVVKYVCTDKNIDSQFLFYLFKNGEPFFKSKVNGTTIPHMNQKFIDEYLCILPPLAEQHLIATFLDKKCSEIDSLIELQEQMIEELKAYKQSVITEAVTKGIRNEELGVRNYKDSGIDWIGDVPEAWEVCRIRNLGITQNGISKGGEFFGEGEPFISYSDVYKNIELPQIASGLIQSSQEEQDRFSVCKGDVFFTRTSETIEEIGFSSTCTKTIEKAVYAGFLIRFRPKQGVLNDGYSKYYFRSDVHRAYFVKEMNIVTRASLSQDLLKSLVVLLPPISEQQAIADYLDKKCGEIDELITIKQQKIESLKEYKKSVIYEYVTGKKEP